MNQTIPEIDYSQLDDEEIEALDAWRLKEAIDKYNKLSSNEVKKAKEYADAIMEMCEHLRKAKPPIGPANDKERDLLVRVSSIAAEAYSRLNGHEWKSHD